MLKSKLRIYVIALPALAMLLQTMAGYAQSNYIPIKLPKAISGIAEEFSGLAVYNQRVYLLPQHGSHKRTKLDGDFNIYTLTTDSVNRVIKGVDTALTCYKTVKVVNLDKLPPGVKKYYEGFETLTIVNNRVYMAIETTDSATNNCYLLKGHLNESKGVITIDPVHYITLKRPLFIKNAGFESVTYLPKQRRLLTLYEFNAAKNGGKGYLIDPDFKLPVKLVKVPFLYFRLTDITAAKNGRLYGINYYWNGEYNAYLSNNELTNAESGIKNTVPTLRDSLNTDPDYLHNGRSTYARIVTLKNYRARKWQHVVEFDSYKNNWEGLALFKEGALIITDANNSKKQVTKLAYIKF